jgi:hypothetical protein
MKIRACRKQATLMKIKACNYQVDVSPKNWRRAADELPEPHKMVLALCKPNIVNLMHVTNMHTAYWCDHENKWWVDGGRKSGQPLFWLPLAADHAKSDQQRMP